MCKQNEDIKLITDEIASYTIELGQKLSQMRSELRQCADRLKGVRDEFCVTEENKEEHDSDSHSH